MKKIIKILLLCLIIVGIVCMATLKFNIGLKYSANVQIGVNIGKEFNLTDIKSIAQETFGTNNVSVQYIELYKDMAQITVKEASDEQIEQLNTKINEKFGLNNSVDDIEINYISSYRLRDIIKPYIIPLIITTVIILTYMAIRFRKIGISKVISQVVLLTVIAELLYGSIIVITRYPVNRLVMPVGVVIYITIITILTGMFEKQKSLLEK